MRPEMKYNRTETAIYQKGNSVYIPFYCGRNEMNFFSGWPIDKRTIK